MVSPLPTLKAHGGCGCKGHIYIATALGRNRVACPTLGRLYPGEKPRYSFYRRLSGPQDQSGYKRVKKNLHPSDTWDRTRAVQPAAKSLLYSIRIKISNCSDFLYLVFISLHTVSTK